MARSLQVFVLSLWGLATVYETIKILCSAHSVYKLRPNVACKLKETGQRLLTIHIRMHTPWPAADDHSYG